VRAFQDAHGLVDDGVCDAQTWAALVEANWELGDRLLFHRVPFLRGDDVAELQRRLGRLGFDAGRVDGIFGPVTARALQDFQRNVGLPDDGICGYESLQALARVAGRTTEGPAVAAVREAAALRVASRTLQDKRVVVGHSGDLSTLARAVSRRLRSAGATVVTVEEPDGSAQASAANRFGADVYVGLVPADRVRIAYYSVPGFESVGGRQLAELLQIGLTAVLRSCHEPPIGMRLPVLRETRMPAVVCELGPVRAVLDASPDVAGTIAHAVGRFAVAPR
jgi:N-acetylmuramoyl-L-alanine amidase